MKVPANGWVISLADLSLILFVVTGLGMAQSPRQDAAQNAVQDAVHDLDNIAEAVPASVLLDEDGGPGLAAWLTRYPLDPTAQLTIHAVYAAGQREAVSGRADELARQAMAAGIQPRVVIEPGQQTQVMALFAYDRDPQVAQGLLREGSS